MILTRNYPAPRWRCYCNSVKNVATRKSTAHRSNVSGQLFGREVSRSQVQKFGAGQALLKALDKMVVFDSLEIQYLSGVEMHTLGSVQVLTENPMGLDCTNLLTSGTDDNTESSL